MSRFQDVIHALTGRLGQEPVSAIPFVATLEDDFLPPIGFFGPFGDAVGAGGAGLRSEILLIAQGLDQKVAIELKNIRVAAAAAGNVEIVAPKQGTVGFVESVHYSGDVDGGKSRFQVHLKNSAVATANVWNLGLVYCAVAETYVPFPGRIVLRAGRLASNAVIVRPTADNVLVRVVGEWRQLEKRSL